MEDIFTVGQLVMTKRWGEQVIERFFIENGDMIAEFKTCRSPLSDLSKLPPTRVALFKDFNGNDVFEGDRVWWVVIHSRDHWTIYNDRMKSTSSFKHERKFLSEDAAKEYVLMNKPCLSLMDILNNWDGADLRDNGLYKQSPMFKRFERAAKSKIKL